MLDRCLQEEQVPSVDERLVKAVRIIVEEYDGDVHAFVESVRCHMEVTNVVEGEREASLGEGAQVAWRHD